MIVDGIAVSKLVRRLRAPQGGAEYPQFDCRIPLLPAALLHLRVEELDA